MWDNLIGKQIRRSTRNLLLWNSLILIGLLVAAVCTSGYWLNFFAGPFPLERNKLLQLRNADVNENFVTIDSDGAVDSGWREITTKKRRGVVTSRRETGKYLLVDIGDKWLIVKVDMDDPVQDKRRTGKLVNLPGQLGSDVVRNYVMATRMAAPAKPLLPMMLDTGNFRIGGWIALVIGVPVALVCAWNVLRAVRRFGNYDSHPLVKVLRRYGEPEEVAAQIEEQATGDDVEDVSGVTFTRSWLIRPTMFGIDLIHLGDAAWVYKTSTKHYTHGIPTGTTYGSVLCDIHGNSMTLQMSESKCDDFAAAVCSRVPWVLAGFDADLQQMWKKNKQELYDLVEQRRKDFAERIRRERDQQDEEPLDVEPA